MGSSTSQSNQYAIIVAYYLSRFDLEGCKKLGFSSISDAFGIAAEKLNVKRNYIKFRRDQFDPIFPWRIGWQRKMDKRIVRAIEAFQDLEEPDLREIVLALLNDEKYRESEEAERIVNSIKYEQKGKSKRESVFILRGPTGRRAEDFFIKNFNETGLPIAGKLVDTRDLGCGYDFEIESSEKKYFIEIKGLSQITGGVLFTNKEWKTAKEKGNFYFLVVVKNIDSIPEIIFIRNPFDKLMPKKSVYTSVQIQWSAPQKELEKYLLNKDFLSEIPDVQ
jgi:hypothetical protein